MFMLNFGDPFSKEELSQALHTVNTALTNFGDGLSPEKFFAHPPEVWSVGDNIQHLILSVSPIVKAVLIPREKLSKRFGLADRPSRPYAAIRDEYKQGLQMGVVAPPEYQPAADALPPDPHLAQAQILTNWRGVSGQLTHFLDAWTETELDTYQVPHLLMGLLTMREMLFFTLYHNFHHLEDAKRLVEATTE
jgi:hypothetical protein